MNGKKTKIIILCLLVGTFLLARYFIPANYPIFAHFLNKNSIKIEVGEDLDESKIKVELSIWGTDYEDVIVHENGIFNSIPKGYGENDWYLSYDKMSWGVFRHFKTNNWHDHHYTLSFYSKDGQILCDAEIKGPDPIRKTTIRLGKKIKTDVGSESGLSIKRRTK